MSTVSLFHGNWAVSVFILQVPQRQVFRHQERFRLDATVKKLDDVILER